MNLITVIRTVRSVWREARDLERKTIARYPHLRR